MRRLAILILALMLLTIPRGFAESEAFDIVISGARVIDGSGNPWYAADVGIRGGLIVEVGNLSKHASTRVIDARGMVLAPGFIDMMGGTTLPLLLDPLTAQSKLRQGVTTMMAGEGDSMAPQDERTIKELSLPGDIPHWTTFREYDRMLDAKGIGINVIHNVGAAQVRRVVIGDQDRAPTPEQLAKMKDIVAEAMQDGSVGLSTALIYPPGTYAKTDELIELAKVAAQYNGVYFSHMRNESAQLLEAIALIQSARDRGVDVTADIYPYIRNGIGLGSFIHPKHYANGTDAFLPTLSDPKVRADLRNEIEATANWENWYHHVGKNWDNVLVVQVPAKVDKRYEGKSVQEIAALRNADVWDTFFYLVQQGGVDVDPMSMNEEQKQQALRAPFVSIGSDAEPMNPLTSTYAHPRTFGTFPRILAKYVREEKVVSLETAIREMTSLPANQLHLWNRGRIAPGLAADLILFDPAKVADTATFAKPLSYAIGMDYVFINGKLAIDKGQPTRALAGVVIRANR